MKKIIHSQTLLGIFGGILGAIGMFAIFFTISSVIAAPTQAPPTGNPTFPLTGPEGVAGPDGPIGPAGPQGSQGIEGPVGPQGPAASVSFDCQTISLSTPGVTLSCNSGYSLTGMIGCRLPSLESAPATNVTNTSVTFNNSGACSSPNYIRCCRAI